MKLLTALSKHAFRQPIRSTAVPPIPVPAGHVDWAKLIEQDNRLWNDARRRARRGPRVLLPTSLGGYAPGTVVEGLLAAALTLRGAQVHFLLCDQQLPACQLTMIQYVPDMTDFMREGPRKVFCAHCFPQGVAAYAGLGLPIHYYSTYLTKEDIASANRLAHQVALSDIPSFSKDGIAVGEHAWAGALRFFARGNLEGEPHGEAIVRRYLDASLQTAFMMQRLYDKLKFKSACYHHGIYVPQGVVEETARKNKARVITWAAGYRKRRFLFAHERTYHHSLLSEPVEHWQALEWTAQLEQQLMSYLASRWEGSRDWIWFHEKPELELAQIASELGVDFNKPCIGMLTNIIWDAQLHYRGNAFPSMLEWTLETIRYFAGRPELQLIVRLHPAESRGTLVSRQLLHDEIRDAFPTLPPNVFIIPATSPISTYAVMSQCNAILIFATKTGIELAPLGLPIITAGEAINRGKGITIDANTRLEYFALLDSLPLQEPPTAAQVERARKYAYHFFFRRMIPLEMFEPQPGWPPYQLRIESLRELEPGASPGLDLVCDGILKGKEFVFPAEFMPETIE